MQLNPYASPSDQPGPKKHASAGLFALYIFTWLCFFLLPAFTATLAPYFPKVLGVPPSQATGDNLLSRVSKTVGIRTEIVIPGALTGCAAVAILAPVAYKWKAAIVIASLPLMVLQMLAIGLTLVMFGRISA